MPLPYNKNTDLPYFYQKKRTKIIPMEGWVSTAEKTFLELSGIGDEEKNLKL